MVAHILVSSTESSVLNKVCHGKGTGRETLRPGMTIPKYFPAELSLCPVHCYVLSVYWGHHTLDSPWSLRSCIFNSLCLNFPLNSANAPLH